MFGLEPETSQDLNLIIAAIQAVGVILSIGFAIRQIKRNSKILAHDSYERLSREYQALLLQPFTHRHLDQVWEPLKPEDRERLEKSIAEKPLWGVWYAMTADEKDCYRFTRSVLEIFERAWQLQQAGHIDEETWKKWSGWVSTWSKSTYFWYILPEASEQLIAGFVKWINENRKNWM